MNHTNTTLRMFAFACLAYSLSMLAVAIPSALLLGGCSGGEPEHDPSTCATSGGHAGASGASAGRAGASGTSGGQAGVSGTSGGQAGVSGTSGGQAGATASLPVGCTPVPGGSPECSGDKKKWYLQCPTAPLDCTKHPFVADVYCCQVIP